MSDDGMMKAAEGAVALARRAGALEVAASVARVRQIDVQWRDGKVEKLSEATTRGLELELYVDGRYAAVSTSDLRPEALERFVGESVALTRKLAPDPQRALPDPSLYAGQAAVDLDLEDRGHAAIEAARRRDLAQAVEAAARSVKGAEAILSVTTSVGDVHVESVRVHSNGFSGGRRETRFWMGGEVSVKDPDGRRPEDAHYAMSRHGADLPAAEAVGRTAGERALGRIGSQKGGSARMTIAVENRAAGRLVGFLLGPMSAAALQQQRSFLEGKLGQQVGSARLDLVDDPLVKRGLGSRLYDGEGIAAKRLTLFEGGVLRGYYVDNYYGRKLGMTPTTRGTSNLTWKLGAKDGRALLKDLREGLLVTGFLGGNSNSTTGDFSLGVQGYRVRDGVRAEPVGEMNLAGNHLELWRQLAAVGNDPYPYSAMRTPTLVFEGVQIAGL